jgi:LDH2 family malate/lactate/ureidoglycolate dehydrogenase
MSKYRPSDLENMAYEILIRAGADPVEAKEVALGVVIANRRGIDSHGLVRLPVYMDRFVAGMITKKTECKIVKETPAAATVDAQNGWGAVAGRYAMNLAIEKAKTCGIGMVTVKNSNHFGIAYNYGRLPLAHDMIGLSLTNASPTLAPWGGREPYFGTNPICICIPAAEERPIVYDGATSVVARGKVVLAAKKGVEIPITWAADKYGRPTTDPKSYMDNGILLPVGGYKGTGFGILVDTLCGLLSGGGWGRSIAELYEAEKPQNVSHFFQAINVSMFTDAAEFKANVDKMVRDIHSNPLAEGTDRIYISGEIEFEKEIATEKNGIEVGQEVIKDLQRYLNMFNVPMPAPIN